MIKNLNGYKIAVAVLSLVVVIEGLFLFSRKPKVVVTKPVAKKHIAVRAEIAIVIDDWGYTLNNVGILAKIKYPVTLAILPNQKYSKIIAQDISVEKNREVILHLPSEPVEKMGLEPDTIRVSMSAAEISKIIANDLGNITYAKGISNHMGSRVTSDEQTMGYILNEVKKDNLYFLDSFVSPKTVCAKVAKEAGVRFARRDIFLDNKKDPTYIRQQILKLKERAIKNGKAIGIGHDHKYTLETLAGMMPGLEEEGIKFVLLSEVVK